MCPGPTIDTADKERVARIDGEIVDRKGGRGGPGLLP